MKSDGLNAYLTTILSAAMLVLAAAQYRTAERQTDIADALAKLEFAKSRARFDVSASHGTSGLMQSSRRLDPQIPATIIVAPTSGVRDIIAVNGQAALFLTAGDENEPCIVAIRGLFTQSTRDRIHLLDPPVRELQGLIDEAEYEGVVAHGLSTELLVSYVNLFGEPAFANLSSDGAELEMSGFNTADTITVFAGAWSGGHGFYFDEGAKPEDACPTFGNKIRKLVEQTNGTSGDEVRNLPPELRRELRRP